MKIFEELVNLLIENNLTLSSVESFTGGLFSSNIVNISHASKVFKGSIVSYMSIIKENLLNISEDIIEKYSVDSKEVALLMSKSGKKLFESDITISFTGEAGPISNVKGVLPGTIFISIIYLNKEYSFSYFIKGDRNKIRKQSIIIGAKKIINLIKRR